MSLFILTALTGLLFFFLPVLYWRARFPEPRWNWDEIDVHDLVFPDAFVFGVATSAHQIEGGSDNNNWSDWGTVRAGGACEHWHRFEQDVDLIRDLGASAHRLSIEWSKLEPSEGELDADVIAHYRRVIDAHRAAGVEVSITLHHFTHPKWFEAKGAFTKEENIAHFVRFAEAMLDEFGDTVRLWWTINEPEVVSVLGYLAGMFPPGRRSLALTGVVIQNLMLAHTAAYHAMKAKRPDVQVGLVKNIFQCEPYSRWSLLDWCVARLADRLMNVRILRFLDTGTFELRFPGWVNIRREVPEGARAFDMIGLNYYSHLTFSVRPWAKEKIAPRFRPDEVRTDMPWTMYPEGMYRALKTIAELGAPVYVTENGIADAEDDRRELWIRRYLYAVSRALRDGVDVRGFSYWSLLDNFEWTEGFGPRFGLYAVDYDTQERTLREGAKAYREIIERARAGRAHETN